MSTTDNNQTMHFTRRGTPILLEDIPAKRTVKTAVKTAMTMTITETILLTLLFTTNISGLAFCAFWGYLRWAV